jgi:hypothetical protein
LTAVGDSFFNKPINLIQREITHWAASAADQKEKRVLSGQAPAAAPPPNAPRLPSPCAPSPLPVFPSRRARPRRRYAPPRESSPSSSRRSFYLPQIRAGQARDHAPRSPEGGGVGLTCALDGRAQRERPAGVGAAVVPDRRRRRGGREADGCAGPSAGERRQHGSATNGR